MEEAINIQAKFQIQQFVFITRHKFCTLSDHLCPGMTCLHGCCCLVVVVFLPWPFQDQASPWNLPLLKWDKVGSQCRNTMRITLSTTSTFPSERFFHLLSWHSKNISRYHLDAKNKSGNCPAPFTLFPQYSVLTQISVCLSYDLIKS